MNKRKCYKLMSALLVITLTISLNIDINIGNYRTSSSPNKHFLQIGMREVEATTGDIKTLGEIPIGSIVYDPSWNWEHKTGDEYSGTGKIKPIEWLVVAKNHLEYPENSVTLYSKSLIARHSYKKPRTITSNHWGNSDIRVWLNNGVFWSTLGSNFKNIIIASTLNNKDSNGDHYSTIDNVFFPSVTEIGNSYSNSDNTNDWGYFSTNASRICSFATTVSDKHYWTRTSTYNSISISFINIDGSIIHGSLSYPDIGSVVSENPRMGVRPALNVISSAKVKEIGPNMYEFIYNSYPTITQTRPSANSPLQGRQAYRKGAV